jgi:Nif-specific regulatory protein
MGTVYLAADLAFGGRPVALKRIRPAVALLPGEQAAAAFKAEFEAMTRLHHPNVVEVYDFGTDQEVGDHFITLEFVEGTDIQEAASRLSVDATVGLFVQICRGLEYIHSRGLLHNDLKPHNIMVTFATPHSCKLMDFGLAAPHSARRDGDEAARRLWGTLHYLAPEVLSGAPPDRRSDLYSLGVLFYRALSDALPFEGEPDEYLRRASTEAPIPLTHRRPDVGPGLESVILRLMARDPAGRPGSAAGVIDELSAATGAHFEVETDATRISYTRSGALVGRDKEIARLVGSLDRATGPLTGSPAGRLVLLSGESGIGKSRLVRQLRYEAELRGASFVSGQCYEGSASAFHPFEQVLRQILHAGQVDETLAPLLASPAQAGDAPPESAKAEPEKEQRRLIESAVESIVSAASVRPLVVCLEDIQWADTASLNLLEHLARNAGTAGAESAAGGLLIVATHRSEDVESPPLAAALARLARAGFWEKIELSRLGEEEVGSMLQGIFGLDSAPPALVSLIVRETEGNPFFVRVAVESLLEERRLARPGIGWLPDAEDPDHIPFPPSVGEAIKRRVSQISPLECQVLEALAVGERPVDKELLSTVAGSGVDAPSVAGAVDGLLRRRLIAREMDASGAIRIRTDHVRIRDHVYESMDWGRRRELHGRFGEALESAGSAGIEELAHHFVNSPDATRALDYARRAGRHAMSLCAAERAVNFFERALELVPPADAGLRLGLQLDLADAHRQGRDNSRAIDGYERIIKGARSAGLKRIAWRATDSLVDVLWRSGQQEEAQRAAERIIPTLRAEGEKKTLAGCLSSLANIAASRGAFDDARRLQEETLALRREIGDRHGTASCLNNLAVMEMLQTPTDRGLLMLEESLAIRREAGDHQRAAETLGNIGLMHRRLGDLAAAAACCEEAAGSARKLKDRWLLGMNQANLAAIYHAQGRMDRALAAAKDAAGVARSIGDEALECEALDYLGMVERDLGSTAESAAAHEKAAATARQAGLTGQEAYALISLILDRLDQEPKALNEMVRRATKVASGMRSQKLLARLHEASARACLASGDADQALAQARSSVQAARAGGHADSEAVAEILVAESLLAQAESGPDAKGSGMVDEAGRTARGACDRAAKGGLAEALWRAWGALASVERQAGRRSAEREALTRAAEAIRRTAESIEDESIRLAYLAEPRRAELMRRASAAAPLRAASRGAAGAAASSEEALSAMYEITSIISSIPDLDTLLQRVLDVGLSIVGGERGLIILIDEASGDQQVRAARELEDETVRDALAYSHSVVKEAAAGRIMVALDASHDDRLRHFKSVSLYSIKSLMCVPMRMRDRIIGTVYVDSRRQGIPFDERDLRFLEAFANLAASAVEQSRLQERLASENVYLRREAGERNRYHNLIGKNVKMQGVYDLMEKVASSTLPVLIQGESGTGKELVARALHYSGPRRNRKFLSENVAAIPDTLLESEMFGHMRGAFTGADRDRKGLFELADGGTLFLDEIGDMSLPMQSKLLRALQDGEIRPVGGKESRKVDVRVISASNKDLDRMMKEGRFREDLYYRLNVVKVSLPPLRERKEDIPLLVDHFLQKAAREPGVPPKRVEVGALQLLLRYGWPGNVRELENEVLRLAVLCPGEVITQRDIMESGELFDKITSLDDKDAFTPLEEVERRQIEKALIESAGNRGRAAELLGISRATIFRKLRKFGIAH